MSAVDTAIARAVRAAKPAAAMVIRPIDEEAVHEMHLILNGLTRVVAHLYLSEELHDVDHLIKAEAEVRACGQHTSAALLRADGLGRTAEVVALHDVIGGLGLVLNSVRRLRQEVAA